jgi:hypothetical protein
MSGSITLIRPSQSSHSESYCDTLAEHLADLYSVSVHRVVVDGSGPPTVVGCAEIASYVRRLVSGWDNVR